MTSPRIEIDLAKLEHNATTLKEMYAAKGIGIMGVTKVVCGDPGYKTSRGCVRQVFRHGLSC